MGEIRVNYGNARRQAQRLRNAADECRQVITRLRGMEGQIPTSWTGEAADTYMLKIQERTAEIGRIQNDLNELAMIIRRVADEFEEAERRAKERIQG